MPSHRIRGRTLKSPPNAAKCSADEARRAGEVPEDEHGGAVRETFFANQMRAAGHEIESPEQGDFVIDAKWLFEIGGRGKGFSQINDKPDSYVVNDGIELGIGSKIPIWLFGFMY